MAIPPQHENNEAKLGREEAKAQHAKYRTHSGGPIQVPSRPP
jgi:hypothetical protein